MFPTYPSIHYFLSDLYYFIFGFYSTQYTVEVKSQSLKFYRVVYKCSFYKCFCSTCWWLLSKTKTNCTVFNKTL